MLPPRPLAALALLASTALPACGSSGVAGTASTSGTGSGGASTGSATTTGSSGTAGSTSTGAGGSGPDAGNPDAGSSDPGAARTIVATNHCAFTVWADALPSTTFPGGLPVQLDPGQSFTAGVDNGWSGRVWGRFGCTTSAAGKLTCPDDPYPSTLSEMTLTQDQGTGLDFYDISLVDGFDLPMALIPVGFTADPAHPFSCGSPTCAMDLRPTCPQPLRDVDASGTTLVCANDACKVLGNNVATSPDCTYPDTYTEFFKTGCPQAYSYPSDDPTSTFTCKGKDYQVVFCP
jgi:hypothetical protein